MKITKKHDTTKIGCGEFPTKIKNEKQKKKVHFLNTIIIQTRMKFQPSCFLYMGNTVKTESSRVRRHHELLVDTFNAHSRKKK